MSKNIINKFFIIETLKNIGYKSFTKKNIHKLFIQLCFYFKLININYVFKLQYVNY